MWYQSIGDLVAVPGLTQQSTLAAQRLTRQMLHQLGVSLSEQSTAKFFFYYVRIAIIATQGVFKLHTQFMPGISAVYEDLACPIPKAY